MEREIVWNKRPSKFLATALKIISDDSIVQAERIEESLITAIQSLISNPEKFPPDKFKENNPGNFRAFEKPPFRIAYKVTERQIRILRMRYIKQEPKGY